MALHAIRRGLDLPLAGGPEPSVEDAPRVSRVALAAADYPGLKPTLFVQPGDRVARGARLFADKRHPDVAYAAPVAGTVAAVNRGERRALVSVVIDVGGEDAVDDALPKAADEAAAIAARLAASGLWTSLRERPFGIVARPDVKPAAIFVTAIDTRPHAPSVARMLAGREDDFARGVAALSRLTDGPVYVCTGPGASLPVKAGANVRVEEFAGPHPAGLPGTHIHLLMPAGHDRVVWYAGCQDVAAIGALMRGAPPDYSRVISLAGPGVARPRHLRTVVGASIDDLAAGSLVPGEQRLVSGSVLDGRVAAGPVEGYLGRYHQQVSALPEGRRRDMFGWIVPSADKFSMWNVVVGALSRRPLALDTNTNGGRRAMVPIGGYERVMPLDILPTFLLRALLMRDDERAEALGALELEEDDLALCTFVSPGKEDFGPLLREALGRLQKEMAT
jgi:Na+-transporting NADH:ubiquinone oxidoreductase subunit A